MEIRLQKYFTDCGVLSRRAAEAEIAAHFALNAVHFTEGRFSFVTEELSEAAVKAKIAAAGFPLVTRIRLL